LRLLSLEPVGEEMPNSDGRKPQWQVLYEAASDETDREKLTELVNRVEEAMMLRTKELAHSANHSEERNAMVQASENLLVIKTEKLSYPPIKMK
jgi:GTP cyclohydrolase I